MLDKPEPMKKTASPSEHAAAASNAAANFADLFDKHPADRMLAVALKQIAVQLILIRGEMAALRVSIDKRKEP
jgi:hypothetical protein